MNNRCESASTARFVILTIFVLVLAMPLYAQTLRGVKHPFLREEKPVHEALDKGRSAQMALGVCDTAQNIEVEATGGILQTGYATLGLAFDAINAGTHTGDIAIEICGSTTEAGPSFLNSSGAGPASYTSVQIYPLIDDAIISANTGVGRGVIELNGADNVTIDGDNPATEGTNRNLTITNTSGATTNYTSVIRLVTSASVTSVNNVTIRNLNLNGSAVGRNISTVTGVGIAVNTTFGIFVGGQGPAVVTDEPLAINSIAVGNTSNSISTTATANNFLAENNSVTNCARAIKFWGRQVERSDSVIIRGNEIGNPVDGDTNGVYSMGISVQGSSSILVSGNTVYVESYLAAPVRGIEIGPEAAVGAFGTVVVEKNQVRRVRSNNTTTRGAYGINNSGGHGHTIRNNFVSGVINTQRTSGGLDTSGAAVGIRLGAGNNHQIFHNSVHLYGAIASGAAQDNLSAAIGVQDNGQTGISIVNNLLSNQMTGGAALYSYHLILQLPYSTISSNRGLTINNNAYFVGTASNSFLAKNGILAPPEASDIFSLANFDPGSRSAQANFRYVTSRLGNTLNDNASFGTNDPPPFVSDSDLHIPTAYLSQLESGGADLGIAEDIDGDPRSSTPDIGADEITAPSAAPVSMSGRVYLAGMRRSGAVRVILSGGDLHRPRTINVNGFGYFRFEGLSAGSTYIVTVSSRDQVFADPVRVINMDNDMTGVDFYPLP